MKLTTLIFMDNKARFAVRVMKDPWVLSATTVSAVVIALIGVHQSAWALSLVPVQWVLVFVQGRILRNKVRLRMSQRRELIFWENELDQCMIALDEAAHFCNDPAAVIAASRAMVVAFNRYDKAYHELRGIEKTTTE